MANHAAGGSHGGDIATHQQTYEGFIRGSVATAIMCGFILVALCSFAFAHSMSVFIGFAGLIAGAIALLIELRTGGRFFGALIVLVAFGILTAINVS